MDVKAEQVVAHGFQVHRMHDEAEVLFNLRMSRIVPVREFGLFDLPEYEMKIAFKGQLFQGFAILCSQSDTARLRFTHRAFSISFVRSKNGPFRDSRFSSTSAHKRPYFGVSFSPALDHFEQLVRVVLHVDAPEVQHHEGALTRAAISRVLMV